MKALITAFALLSFVAASTVPLAAQAQTQTEIHKSTTKKAKKHHVASAKKHHKTVAKNSHRKKSPTMPAKG
jgi:Ni/Co efflux regulator RcnB